MVNITIDGKKVKAKEGASVLQLAQDLKIDIPTLCYHGELSPFGACRLCTVEVKENGHWKLAASCTTPVAQNMEVRTSTKKVQDSRAFAAGMLAYKYPNDPVVREMAAKLGAKVEAAKSDTNECILCGLCVRACQEIVDVNAVKFRDRGLNRQVEEPAIEFDPSLCIGCGSCAYVCPTRFVKMESSQGERTIWNKVFRMAQCSVCGRDFAPVEQLEYISKKTGVPLSKLMVCVSCR